MALFGGGTKAEVGTPAARACALEHARHVKMHVPTRSAPASAAAARPTPTHNTTNGSGVSEARRMQLLDAWGEERRREKRERRLSRRTAEQRQSAADKEQERLASGTLRVRVEVLGRASVRLRLLREVHEGALVPYLVSAVA